MYIHIYISITILLTELQIMLVNTTLMYAVTWAPRHVTQRSHQLLQVQFGQPQPLSDSQQQLQEQK